MKYLKKPIVIEAKQLKNDYDNILNIFEWVYDEDTSTSKIGQNGTVNIVQKEKCLIIPTLEGNVKAYFGDYIIKGVNGEFYPCSENKFKKIYSYISGNRYKKNPIKVEAKQYNGKLESICEFCPIYKMNENKEIMVRTSDGKWLIASKDDYIIKEDGGFHPVKPDIFKKTYEEIK